MLVINFMLSNEVYRNKERALALNPWFNNPEPLKIKIQLL